MNFKEFLTAAIATSTVLTANGCTTVSTASADPVQESKMCKVFYAPDMHINDSIQEKKESIKLIDTQIFASGDKNSFIGDFKRLNEANEQIGEIINLKAGEHVDVAGLTGKYELQLNDIIPGVGGDNLAKVTILEPCMPVTPITGRVGPIDQ